MTAQTTPRGKSRLVITAPGASDAAFGGTEWVLLTSSALIWGSSFLLIATALTSFAPGVIAFGRVALGALALALVPRARKHVDRGDLPRIALVGVVWIGAPMILFPVAQQWVDSAVAGMLNGAVPLAAAIWSTILLRRLPGPRQRWGLGVGLAGMLAITVPVAAGSSASTTGVLLILLAIACYGLAVNLAVPLQQRYGALPVLLRAQLTALVVLAPFAAAQLPASQWAWSSALAMLPLGVLSTGLAFVLMATLVGRVGAARGSVAIYLVPVVAILLGTVVRGEQLPPLALAGTALVLAGAWLTSRAERSGDR